MQVGLNLEKQALDCNFNSDRKKNICVIKRARLPKPAQNQLKPTLLPSGAEVNNNFKLRLNKALVI